MSTTHEALNHCLTNTYILPDYTDIAYIVCTHTPSAGAEASNNEIPPDQILLKLRIAEKQFRQASILAALDVEKLELFTFYKKVDVVKDQRTILNRFGHVCRLNSCTIARKSAARILDLLKPDSHRVYQLFTHAILQNIQLQFPLLEKPVLIGTKVYLSPARKARVLSGLAQAVDHKLWYLSRMTIQVLAGGQVVLNLQQSKAGPLLSLDELDNRECEALVSATNSLLYLAPTGQLARYKGKHQDVISEVNRSDQLSSGSARTTETKQTSWKAFVLAWLSKRGDGMVGVDAAGDWIEMEIPMFEETSNVTGASTKKLTWRQIVWPAQYSYVFASTTTAEEATGSDELKTDPMKFAQDWFNDSVHRNSLVAAAQATKDKRKNSLEDETLFDGDASFEDQGPAHVFEPPTFPASQIIYPTPPDGPMTHATPGMSSVDGLAPTPMQLSQQNHAQNDSVADLEMQDIDSTRQPTIDSGNQDEDLFEGMPDDTFETDGILDEPDWDFFDEPAMAATTSAGPDSGNGMNSGTDREEGQSQTLLKPGTHTSVRISTAMQDQEIFHNPDNSSSVPVHNATESDSAQRQAGKLSETVAAREQDAVDMTQDQIIDNKQEVEPNITAAANSLDVASRRSSIYENIDVKPSTSDYDSRYKTQGKYWFDPVASSNFKRDIPNNSATSIRPVSSGSDSSNSSNDSSSDSLNAPRRTRDNKNQQTWASYEPEVVLNETIAKDAHQQISDADDNAAIMKVIASARSDEPFLYDVTSLIPTEGNSGIDEDDETAGMVAQILVDQISQSSILRHMQIISPYSDDFWCDVEVSLNHNEAKRHIPNASLSELTGINQGSSTILPEKVGSLPHPRIVVNRGDEVIDADATMLRFWDTLGLQPAHGPKNVTTFCLCPAESTIVDACSTFLRRISDTYTGCNFGSHLLGKISGLTSDGVLTWQNGIPGAKLFCQQVGVGLASASDLRGTIIVYLVCPAGDMLHCREFCHAFALLFEAFAKTSSDLAHEVELVLQLIPVSFIASSDTLVVPRRESYLELAIEVYNRIPSNSDAVLPAVCASAVILGQSQPSKIDFDLDVNAPNPLFKDGACLHLAYSCSVDGRWLVAAWSDEVGTKALTMSYLLKGKDASSRARRDVLRDMWEISHEIMKQEARRWRLAVVKTGFFLPEELNEWLQLVNQASQDRPSSAKIILLSADVDGAMKLQARERLARTLPTSISGGHHTGTTPVTTPQHNSTSPDHGIAATPTPGGLSHANPPTPPDHHYDSNVDAESVLVDPNEDSWSVILGFGVNQSDEVSAIRPAGASGFLVKRAPDQDDPGRLAVMQVHLSATSRSTPASPGQKEREAILQDMLGHFRRLVMLAATRGCIDQDHECVPWHIATALKGAKALGQVM